VEETQPEKTSFEGVLVNVDEEISTLVHIRNISDPTALLQASIRSCEKVAHALLRLACKSDGGSLATQMHDCSRPSGMFFI